MQLPLDSLPSGSIIPKIGDQLHLGRRSFLERLKWRLLRTVGITPNFLSFSQAGEDRILQHLCGVLAISRPFYVDLGCNHPTYANNTYLFYCQGGCGIVVDPVREFAAQYSRLRPRDCFVHAAVSDSVEKTSSMTVFENSSLNTLDADTAALYISMGHKALRVDEVRTLTLSTILKMAGRDVDLLSIDAEGLDLSILQSCDFKHFAPCIICVETVGYSDKQNEVFCDDTARFLQTVGYVQYANSHINTIFVNQKRYAGAIKL